LLEIVKLGGREDSTEAIENVIVCVGMGWRMAVEAV